MTDAGISALRTLAREMEEEAKSRRKLTPTAPDAVAEACDYWAGRAATRAEELEREGATLTPAQFAALHNVTEQTVRNWIRRGELTAEPTASGYRIARSAVRVPGRRKAIAVGARA
jgi:excisionase family DNA binding protein